MVDVGVVNHADQRGCDQQEDACVIETRAHGGDFVGVDFQHMEDCRTGETHDEAGEEQVENEVVRLVCV